MGPIIRIEIHLTNLTHERIPGIRSCTLVVKRLLYHLIQPRQILQHPVRFRQPVGHGVLGIAQKRRQSGALLHDFPGDGGKGPNGPRNVVYNCDISSPLGSVWLGGMNENWLILYNRFTSEKGPGVLLQNQAFETIIKGNVFRISNPNSPMVLLRDPDCSGVEIRDNILIGGSAIWAGLIAPEVNSGNRKLPAGTDMEAVAPEIAVPSLYEWQLRKKGIVR